MEMATSAKVGTVAVATTATASANTWFNWIPEDIGAFAALIAVILSAVLIIVNLGRFVLEIMQAMLKMKIMNKQLEDKE